MRLSTKPGKWLRPLCSSLVASTRSSDVNRPDGAKLRKGERERSEREVHIVVAGTLRPNMLMLDAPQDRSRRYRDRAFGVRRGRLRTDSGFGPAYLGAGHNRSSRLNDLDSSRYHHDDIGDRCCTAGVHRRTPQVERRSNGRLGQLQRCGDEWRRASGHSARDRVHARAVRRGP